MPDQMQRYVELKRKMPAKRNASDRKQDFSEIYDDFTPEEAQRQASRCEQCGVPYCQIFCPLHNNIPDWLKATAEGRLQDAYELAQTTNNFPEICGRICPQDRLCEAKWACTLEQAGHGTVTIGAVERHITDHAWRQGWVKPRRPSTELKERVAIVGAGPAGMAAAEELRALGYQVSLFDRHERMGGLLAFGIPGFKLGNDVVRQRERLLLDAGIEFHGGHQLGRNLSFEVLRSRHDAALLAFGAYRAHHLDIPGSHLTGVLPALDYLIAAQSAQAGGLRNAEFDARDRKVVVVGGGDTAMDCVRTAVRQRAGSVTCLYRRDRSNMPGSSREVSHAEEEGVAFAWQLQPEALLGVPVKVLPGAPVRLGGSGRVSSVQAVRTELSRRMADGRQKPEPVAGAEITLEADLVINALGFAVEDVAALTDGAIQCSTGGKVSIDAQTMMTQVDGVFAAGDAVRGPSLAVWAIRDGRDAATRIDRYLKQRTRISEGSKPRIAVAAE